MENRTLRSWCIQLLLLLLFVGRVIEFCDKDGRIPWFVVRSFPMARSRWLRVRPRLLAVAAAC
jgi:hypothetical protein